MSRFSFRLLIVGLALALFPRLASAAAPGSVVAWGAGEVGDSGYPNYGQSIVPTTAQSGVVALAGGALSSVALKDNGTVVTWGFNDVGQLTVPAGLTGVVAIAMSPDSVHTLALKSNGTLVAWGYNTYGQVTGTPTVTTPQIATANPVTLGGQVLSNVVAMATGHLHSVAAKSDGTVVAWGYNGFGVTNVPVGLSGVIALAAGADHTLALKSDGTVVAWGGLNTYGEATVPPTLSGVVAISAAQSHSVALKSDGTVVAWGSNFYGQTNVPVGLTGVVAISSGESHILALKSDGTMVAWGNSGDGQTTIPATAQSCVLALAAGGRHSLAIVSTPPVITIPPASQVRLAGQTATFTATVTGTPTLAYQWSLDGSPLADGGHISGATTAQLTVTNVTPAEAGDYTVEVSNCAASVTHPTPAVLTVLTTVPPGGVMTWGDNTFAQIPVPLAARAGVVAVAAGQGHTLALKSNGQLLAWGWNTSGQTNVPFATLNGSVAIAAGQAHSLALRSDGIVFAWGNNAEGQTNVPIAAQSGVIAISAGGSHSVALKNDGTVVAWGHNGFGQSTVPSGLSDVIALAAGFYHTIALKADGTVVAWGDDTHDQSSVPPGLSGGVAIAAGFYHSLAVKGDGSVVAWGAGVTNTGVSPHYGQSLVPSGVMTATSAAAGRYHSLALMNDKTLVAWGDNTAGQTSIPGAAQGHVLAVAAGWMHSAAIVRTSPIIIDLPYEILVNLDRHVNLTVRAEGTPPLRYQWRRQSALGTSDIVGATGPTLSLTNVQSSQAGHYIVVVSNDFGSVTSTPPTMLTVLTPTTFALWRESHFTTAQLDDPAISGPLATPANDGLPNLLKYAFNLAPFGPDPMSPGVGPQKLPLALTRWEEGLVLVFQAIRTDLVYTVKASTDLTTWGNEGVMVETNGTVRTATFNPPASRAFLRIDVSFASPL